MRWLEYSGHGVPWFILVALFFLLGSKSGVPPAVSLNLLTLLVVDLLLAATVKAIVQRPRPGYNDKGTSTAIVALTGCGAQGPQAPGHVPTPASLPLSRPTCR